MWRLIIVTEVAEVMRAKPYTPALPNQRATGQMDY